MEKQLYEQAEFWYRVTFECKLEPRILGMIRATIHVFLVYSFVCAIFMWGN